MIDADSGSLVIKRFGEEVLMTSGLCLPMAVFFGIRGRRVRTPDLLPGRLRQVRWDLFGPKSLRNSITNSLAGNEA